MKLSIGFSPCPNDTFIFDALINKKIDTGDLELEAVLEDVETLNRWALQGKLDITKLSFGVLPLVMQQYKLLDSGSALGQGVGPLLITKDADLEANVEDQLIAIPGEHTTAHLLFSLKHPKATKKVFVRYNEVEDFVLAGKGLGVIIHENRFTYKEKGLFKIADLGDYWTTQTGVPIPLGGIVMKQSFGKALQQKVSRLIEKSIRYSFSSYPIVSDYVSAHAQEMSEDVMRKHIDLYVNDYSLSLGPTGEQAVDTLLNVYNNLKSPR
ncbi:MAG: 1,4-dihydroxy-6-naphthoate synthase [Chitinophagaceae bacterium]|nr:MAG: 1,4-dihydroxy-6-naphthoate synthase [Chitinophagaceae bacterium]